MSVSVLRNRNPLAVNPLKVSQPVGAALAFLGINRTMPLMHGSQGCTAFAKVLAVGHFREPIPLQTTAMDQVSTVMGCDESVVEALATIFTKNKPQLIGLMTTGLTETQGSDIRRAVKMFRSAHPEFGDRHVVAINTPDFTGSLESGFAAAVKGIIETVVPEGDTAGSRKRQVNVLAGAHLTPGDLEALRDLLEAFELHPVILPDLADSLDGHLTPEDFTPYTVGGTPLSDIVAMGQSAATLVIGASLAGAADLLATRTGVPEYRFDHLYGLDAVDRFVHVLSQVAQRPVPAKLLRQRAQLQDAMVDTHFMLGMARVAVAGEPDHVLAQTTLLQSMGAKVVAAVLPNRGAALERLELAEVHVGDLRDFERLAFERKAELMIGNSHVGQTAERLALPLLRMGFPLSDRVGAYQRTSVGYRGSRQLLFDLANLRLAHGHHAIPPHISRYADGRE